MTERSLESTDRVTKGTAPSVIVDAGLLEDLRGLIESAKSRFAQDRQCCAGHIVLEYREAH